MYGLSVRSVQSVRVGAQNFVFMYGPSVYMCGQCVCIWPKYLCEGVGRG